MATFIPKDKPSITKSRYSMVFLALFIVGLYALQSKAIIPFVESVVSSDLFDIDSSKVDGVDVSSAAFQQCNAQVGNELGTAGLDFSQTDFRSWELGGGKYLITSSLSALDEQGHKTQKHYACNIQFVGGNAQDAGNWTLNGLEIKGE